MSLFFFFLRLDFDFINEFNLKKNIFKKIIIASSEFFLSLLLKCFIGIFIVLFLFIRNTRLYNKKFIKKLLGYI